MLQIILTILRGIAHPANPEILTQTYLIPDFHAILQSPPPSPPTISRLSHPACTYFRVSVTGSVFSLLSICGAAAKLFQFTF